MKNIFTNEEKKTFEAIDLIKYGLDFPRALRVKEDKEVLGGVIISPLPEDSRKVVTDEQGTKTIYDVYAVEHGLYATVALDSTDSHEVCTAPYESVGVNWNEVQEVYLKHCTGNMPLEKFLEKQGFKKTSHGAIYKRF
jgi:hypothetical protein|nr:MAG TPA: hypothetical protein [Caudoviricetes sp.]